MSKILQKNQGKLQDFEYLLDGLQLEVQKKSNKTNGFITKILTYNKGYVQYMNKDEFIARQNHQSKSKLSIEDYILNHGYLIYKAGVNINIIKKNEDRIKFGWTNDLETEYYFLFKFLIKHKIIYNPGPNIQKEKKEKKEKNPKKDVIWQFEVKLESEINKIKNRLAEIEKKKRILQHHIVCDQFIEKFDQMDIQIQSSESLETELLQFAIDVQFLGYISKKLNNTTNRKIVNADIAARSLFKHKSESNNYQLTKITIIEKMLNDLYSGQTRNFDQNVIQIAKDQFQSNIEDSEFAIVDVLLLNALMYHFQFSIDLNVNKLINFTGFYASLDFKSLRDQSGKENYILFSDISDEEKYMNYKNFQKIQQKYKISDIEEYCIGLFGEENQYLGMFYLQQYEKNKKPVEHQQKPVQHYQQKPVEHYQQKPVELLKKAVKLFEKHLTHSHSLHIKALNLLHQEELNQEQISIINWTGMDQKAPSQESQLKYITFQSDLTKSTNISRSSQSSEKYSFQIAEENYEKGQFISAQSAIDKIQNKDNKVLTLGFKIEKQINDPNNSFYSDRLFNNYIIFGCSVKDYPTILEILQFQFKNYVFITKISFNTQKWIQIINQLKTRSFTVEQILIVNNIIDIIRLDRYNDAKQYFNSLISKLILETDSKQDQINQYLDQFQLISQQYFKTYTNY